MTVVGIPSIVAHCAGLVIGRLFAAIDAPGNRVFLDSAEDSGGALPHGGLFG